MAERSRSGQIVLWWKSRKVIRERLFSSRGGFTSLYKSGSMRSFLDTGANRERGRGGKEGHQNLKLAPWDEVQSWPKFGHLERAGIHCGLSSYDCANHRLNVESGVRAHSPGLTRVG
jgi:hypothetical protein